MDTGQRSIIGDLIQRARSGDGEALDELFRLCRNYLGIVARAQVETWLRAKVDASDLVQQTLLEAHRDFGRFQGASEAEWLAWLKRILSHNAADFVRQYYGTEKRQARREVPLQRAAPDDRTRVAVLDPSDGGETPSQQIMRKERELLVADALADLPNDYREVIMLRNLQHLPFNEVARRMDRTRPAVQMLWMRAVRKLQQVLADR